MSWLKIVAGKAEDLLNQIDQNAAVAFQSDKEKGASRKDDILTEVTWDTPSPVRESSVPRSPRGSSSQFSLTTVKSAPSLSSPLRGVRKQDDDLIKYLNSPEPDSSFIGVRSVSSTADVDSSQLPIHHDTVVGPDQRFHSSHSGSSASSRRSSLHSFSASQPLASRGGLASDSEPYNVDIMRAYDELKTENTLLKNEIRSLNGELSQLLHRTKGAEKSCSEMKVQLNILEEKEKLAKGLQDELDMVKMHADASDELILALQSEKEKLEQSSFDYSGVQEKELQIIQEKLRTTEESHLEKLANLNKQCSRLEEDWGNSTNLINELQQKLENYKEKINTLESLCDKHRKESKEAHDELEQYRSRAQRILQEKERLITQLRGDGPTNSLDDSLAHEVQKLTQERELLREETLQVSARLQAARDELLEEEKKFEAFRDQSLEAKRKLQNDLQEEKKKRQAAEEDSRTHGEELRSVRDELSRQRNVLATRVKEREAELSRLRAQLSLRPSSDDELEHRIHSLTQTLVKKQTTLETLTTERNALRLQLEKVENKHRHVTTLLHQYQCSRVSVNDTDDAKAQIPSLFVESPFDTGISRRVKRAYSSLDAVSIRTGVFLRRYPLARILVLCYMVLLHLWVMLVLFSYTPQPQ